MVNLFNKTFWTKKPAWLKGGIIGIGVCLALFIFYLIYIPVVTDSSGLLSDNAMLLPTITGHTFPLFAGFIVPYGLFCEKSVQECTYWVSTDFAVEENISCHNPWEMEETTGCCVTKIKTPTEFCANVSEAIGFFGLLFILFGVYFSIGAGIAKTVEIKNKNKK